MHPKAPAKCAHRSDGCLRKIARSSSCTPSGRAVQTPADSSPLLHSCGKKTAYPHLQLLSQQRFGYPPPVIAVRLQTPSTAAVGTHLRSSHPALIPFANVGSDVDLYFDDDLHAASFCPAHLPRATPQCLLTQNLSHFPPGILFNFPASIVYPVSGFSAQRNNIGNRVHGFTEKPSRASSHRSWKPLIADILQQVEQGNRICQETRN